MNRLPKAKQIQVVAALVEGCSIRATVRMTGVANRRYSPAVCTGAEKIVRTGNPDMKHVSTSYVER